MITNAESLKGACETARGRGNAVSFHMVQQMVYPKNSKTRNSGALKGERIRRGAAHNTFEILNGNSAHLCVDGIFGRNGAKGKTAQVFQLEFKQIMSDKTVGRAPRIMAKARPIAMPRGGRMEHTYWKLPKR